MFIIEYLPEFIVHAIFGIGVIGLVVGSVSGMIPGIRVYKLAIQIVSLIVFALGVYLQGALENTKIWKQRVLELEVKVKESEIKSAEVNTVIQEKTVTNTKIVREKADAIIKYIDRDVVKKEEVVKYIDRCVVPQDIVDAHNKAIDELNKSVEKQK